jgi:phage portal protein BeeE
MTSTSRMTDQARIDNIYSQARSEVASEFVKQAPGQSAITQPIVNRRGGGVGGSSYNQRQKMESLFRHYRGRPYSATRVLSQRIAARPFHVAKKVRKRDRSFAKSFSHGDFKGAIPTVLQSLSLDRWRLDENHGIARVIREPNKHMTQHTLMDFSVQNLIVTGQAFWVVTESSRPGYPFDLVPMPSTWMQPVNAEGLMSHWKICPPGVLEHNITPISDEFVLRFAFWDPSSYGEAMSPLSMLARAILNDESISEAQHNAFHNGGRPSFAVITGPDMVDQIDGYTPGRVALSADQRDEILEWVVQQVAGVGNEGRPIVLDSVIQDVKVLSNTPREMAFLESAGLTAEQIFEGIGVPTVAAGRVENVTRESSATADGHLANNAANPIVSLFNQVIMKKMLGLINANQLQLRLGFDEVVVEDETIKNERMALAIRYWAATLNDVREFAGLPRTPGGDVNPLPGKAQLVNIMGAEPTVALPVAGLPEPEDESEEDDETETRKWLRQLEFPWQNGNGHANRLDLLSQ